MRARIVFHNGETEKTNGVLSVREEGEQLHVDTEGALLVYHKPSVAFFQVVWHPDA